MLVFAFFVVVDVADFDDVKFAVNVFHIMLQAFQLTEHHIQVDVVAFLSGMRQLYIRFQHQYFFFLSRMFVMSPHHVQRRDMGVFINRHAISLLVIDFYKSRNLSVEAAMHIGAAMSVAKGNRVTGDKALIGQSVQIFKIAHQISGSFVLMQFMSGCQFDMGFKQQNTPPESLRACAFEQAGKMDIRVVNEHARYAFLGKELEKGALTERIGGKDAYSGSGR
jgi:hypothetical protein